MPKPSPITQIDEIDILREGFDAPAVVVLTGMSSMNGCNGSAGTTELFGVAKARAAIASRRT